MTGPNVLPPPSSTPGPYRQTITPAAHSVGKVGVPHDRYHVVQPGESLWGIAQAYYNKPNEWPTIFNANRTDVQRPDKTFGPLTGAFAAPGDRLHIP